MIASPDLPPLPRHQPPAAAGAVSSRRAAPILVALLWGFAESTVFFLAPDILITRLALRDLRRAVIASLYAVVGLLLGSAVLWYVAQRANGPQTLLNAFDWIPGISRDLMIRTAQSLHTFGLPTLFPAALTFQPVKLYTIHASAQGLALLPFLVAVALAHFARFTLLALLSSVIARLLPALSPRLHVWLWIAFYTTYLALHR
jgi:membrane protein YqaA with SNARE-associated domain